MIDLVKVSRTLWYEVADRCKWATYFHTPMWAEIIANTFPAFEPSAMGFMLKDNITAVIPFVCRKKGGIFKKLEYKSMEPGVYGGIIAEKDLCQDETDKIALSLLRMKKTSGRIVGSPFKKINLPSSYKSKKISTHIVSLEDGFDKICKKFSRGQKSNIKQAKKKGVVIRRAETEEDVRHYYHMYQETVKRWGADAKTVYPYHFFSNIYKEQSSGAHIWIAEVKGLPAAAIIVLAWNNNLIYWHGCALQEYFKYYPNNLLHTQVLEWACENNFKFYDMGASMGMQGVAKFKESFGAKPYYFNAFRW